MRNVVQNEKFCYKALYYTKITNGLIELFEIHQSLLEDVTVKNSGMNSERNCACISVKLTTKNLDFMSRHFIVVSSLSQPLSKVRHATQKGAWVLAGAQNSVCYMEASLVLIYYFIVLSCFMYCGCIEDFLLKKVFDSDSKTYSFQNTYKGILLLTAITDLLLMSGVKPNFGVFFNQGFTSVYIKLPYVAKVRNITEVFLQINKQVIRA